MWLHIFSAQMKGMDEEMKKVRIVLSGASGYGSYYLQLLEEQVDQSRFQLVGIVDPFVKEISSEWAKQQHIPLYASLENFYQADSADLAILACPIQFHKDQALLAMQNGSHVLCEKPLTVKVSDALEMQSAAEKYGKYLAVGFQWSYCTPILTLKRDMLAGKFGKPMMLKTLISWQRFDNYYQSSFWKGRIHDANGFLIQDSVATNATAHYLHNLFFMMGDSLSSAAMPEVVQFSTWRAKDIESFDTCFAKGRFASGAQFLYIATHSGDRGIEPIFQYEFENAVAVLKKVDDIPQITVQYRDGRTVDYGTPQSDHSNSEKITAMLDAIQDDNPSAVTCPVSASLPHLAVCNGFFQERAIETLPQERTFRTKNPAGSFMHGLADECFDCYNQGLLPSEVSLEWAIQESCFDPRQYLKA